MFMSFEVDGNVLLHALATLPEAENILESLISSISNGKTTQAGSLTPVLLISYLSYSNLQS